MTDRTNLIPDFRRRTLMPTEEPQSEANRAARWAICAIVTKSHLAHARALALSAREHNPNLPVYVALADRTDGCFDPREEPFELIELERLGDPSVIERMCFYYTAFELSCALRAWLHQFMLEQTPCERWIFLDSDIMVLDDLNELFKRMDHCSVLLTAHCTRPMYPDHRDCPESELIKSGMFNAGVLGLKRGDTARAFIVWLRQRLERHCLVDELHFVDQGWLSLVPLFFRDYEVVDDPCANLGHWNLFECDLTEDEQGRVLGNGRPVIVSHFSGMDVDDEECVSRYAPWYDGKVPAGWKSLRSRYLRLLHECGLESAMELPYAFASFSDGTEISEQIRRKYYVQVMSGQHQVDNPFDHPERLLLDREQTLSLPKRLLQPFLKLIRNGR